MSRAPSAPAGRTITLAVLTLLLGFNSMERLAFGLLLQDMKLDLQLSDLQLGLLGGIAFSLFYSSMGLVIARWADRGNRVSIISITTAVWAITLALCGTATSFVQLLAARIAVAVGEAGCVPPSNSILADLYDRRERPRAMAIFMMGGPISVLIGLFAAGWLNQLFGWRQTFFILAIPGLLLALLVRLAISEPRRPLAPRADGAAAQGIVQVARELWKNRTFRHILLGYSVAAFFGNGIAQWQPSFFIRSYGVQTGELGTWLALVYGLGGLVGIYLGGEYASRRAARREAHQLKVIALAYAVFGFISTFIYIAPNFPLAMLAICLSSLGGAIAFAPLFAIIQTVVAPNSRATSIALLYLTANLIGMGLGPLAAGALSELLAASTHAESLRWSLLALCPGYGWAAFHLWRASFTATQDVENASPEHQS